MPCYAPYQLPNCLHRYYPIHYALAFWPGRPFSSWLRLQAGRTPGSLLSPSFGSQRPFELVLASAFDVSPVSGSDKPADSAGPSTETCCCHPFPDQPHSHHRRPAINTTNFHRPDCYYSSIIPWGHLCYHHAPILSLACPCPFPCPCCRRGRPVQNLGTACQLIAGLPARVLGPASCKSV